jgi:hypothetical protein
MASYYYLVASLPDLSLEQDHSKLDVEEVYENIVQNLEDDDIEDLKLFILQNDLRNIVRVICSNHGLKLPYPFFFQPAFFTIEQIEELHSNLDILPGFLVRLLEENEDDLKEMDPRQIESLFFNAYYEQCQNSSNSFIRTYSSFELSLRNIIAGLNSRKYDKDAAEHLLDDLYTFGAISKSNARDFGLSDFFPYITKLQELIDAGDVMKLEAFVEELKWNYVEEITSASFFDINVILGYTTKLLMIKRKTQFKPEEGSKRVVSIIDEAMKNLEVPVG